MWQPFERLWQFKSLTLEKESRQSRHSPADLTFERASTQYLVANAFKVRNSYWNTKTCVTWVCRFDASPFSHVLQSYSLHTEKRCEEPSNLGNIIWLWVVFWNTFRFQWMLESAVYVWGALFQVLKLRPGTCANNILQRGWTRGAGPLFSSHCFHAFSTSSWKVQKCTSKRILHQTLCFTASSFPAETLRGVQRICHVDPRAFCVCASKAPHQKLLEITNWYKPHKSHSKEKSKSPCGKPLNSLRRWISKKFWKVVSSCQLLETSQSVSSSF